MSTTAPSAAPGRGGRLTALRAPLAEVVRFEPGAFAPLAGLRVGIGVVVAVVVGLAAGDHTTAATMGAGALLTAIPTATVPTRTSIAGIVAISGAMALSVFVGSASGEIGWLHTVVLVPWCLVGGLLMGQPSPASAVGNQAVAAMIVFGRFSEPPLGALELAGLVLAGSAVALGVLVATRHPLGVAAQRQALRRAAVALAALARSPNRERDGFAAGEAGDAAGQLLGRQIGDPRDREVLRSLLDVLVRMRTTILAVDGIERAIARMVGTAGSEGTARTAGTSKTAGTARPDGTEEAARTEGTASTARTAEIAGTGSTDEAASTDEPHGTDEAVRAAVLPAVDAALSQVGDVVAELGEALARPGAGAPGREAAIAGLDAATALLEHAEHHGGPPGLSALSTAVADHLQALGGQLRAATDLGGRAGAPESGGLTIRGVLLPRRGLRQRVQELADRLQADAAWSSPVGRHALRLAVVVSIGEVIALHTPLARGYWIALTAAIVLRPDFASTFGRGLARTIGTSIGVLLAGLLAVAVRPVGAAEVVALGVLCALCASGFLVSYVLFSALLTGLVVLLVALVTPGTVSTALDRLLDTVIGGGLAMIAYVAWPTWSKTTAPRAFAQLVEALADYLDAALGMVTGTRGRDPRALAARARAVRRARAEAEGIVARALDEPPAARLDLHRGRGLLAASGRIGLTVHSVRGQLDRKEPAGAVPELAPLAEALGAALRDVAAALRAEQAVPVPDRLATLATRSTLGSLRPLRPLLGGLGAVSVPVLTPQALPPLRRLHAEAARRLEARPDLAPLLAECDELVDAVDTLAESVGLEPPLTGPVPVVVDGQGGQRGLRARTEGESSGSRLDDDEGGTDRPQRDHHATAVGRQEGRRKGGRRRGGGKPDRRGGDPLLAAGEAHEQGHVGARGEEGDEAEVPQRPEGGEGTEQR